MIECSKGKCFPYYEGKEDDIQGCWKKGKFYEIAMLEYIAHTYNGGTFIDIGSCIGNHTLFFSKFCADKVISFEPVNENYLFQMNLLSMNEVKNTVVYNMALSNYIGKGKMVDKECSYYSKGLWSLQESDNSSLEVTTLDLMVNKINDITLIKIDTEGSEYKILQGAEKTIIKQKPVIFCECITKPEYSQVSNYLKKFSYTVKNKFNATPTYEFVYNKK